MGKKSGRKRKNKELLSVEEKSEGPASNLEKVCLFIIRWGVYLALFSPLIILKTSFFPFVTPKTIYFRVLVEIIFGAWLVLAIARPRYRPNFKSPLFIVIALFLAVLIFTSFTGVNFARSFFSTYERMTGLFTGFHLLAFFLVLTSSFKTRKDWRKILAVSVFVGVLLSLYVLLSDQLSSRGGGTIGNTSFMAAYLLFDIFFALILLLSALPLSFREQSFSNDSWGWSIYSGISLLVLITALMISTARGAILAFFGGLAFLMLGYMLFSRKKLLKRLALGFILLALLVSLVSVVFQPSFLKHKISHTLYQMSPRLTMWNIAWQGWQDRFWLGWGPENFNAVFSKHFDPVLFTSRGGGEIWFDRAHNIIFDVGTSSGIVGFLSYLSIFGVAVILLLRTCPKVKEGKNLFIPLATAALLLVYLVQNTLVFDMINSYLVFFLCLAFAGFLITEPGPQMSEKSSRSFENTQSGRLSIGYSWKKALGLASPAIILLIILFCFGNIQVLRTAKSIAMTMALGPDVVRAAPFFEKSFGSWMLKYEPREQFAQKLYQWQPQNDRAREDAKPIFDKAILEMEKSCKRNSLDFRHHLFLGRLYTTYYRIFQDKEKLKKAQDIMEKAITLSPHNQQGYWQLAEINFAQQNYKRATELLKKAVQLEPSFNQSHWYLAIGYQLSGDYEKAREEVEKSGGGSWQSDLEGLKRATHIYTTLGDIEGLIPYYEQFLEYKPVNPSVWAQLIRFYAQLAQQEKAQATIQKLIQQHPEIVSQVKELLEGASQ